MTECFPFNKKVSSAYINVNLWLVGDLDYVKAGKSFVQRLHVYGKSQHVQTIVGSKVTDYYADVTKLNEVEQLFQSFFNITNGEVDDLSLFVRFNHLDPSETEEAALSRLSNFLANRPIKVKLFRQNGLSGSDLNSPSNAFFRDYIDYEMYATIFPRPDQPPFVISQKLVNCEFLYLDVKLANSEVLEGFKGWGLVLRREDPIYNFDFLAKVFQKWYSGQETQWKYLCVACNVFSDSCEPMFSLGRKIEIIRFADLTSVKYSPVTEYEIIREDVNICHLGGTLFKRVHESEPRLFYFYTGECSDEMFLFHHSNNCLD